MASREAAIFFLNIFFLLHRNYVKNAGEKKEKNLENMKKMSPSPLKSSPGRWTEMIFNGGPTVGNFAVSRNDMGILQIPV